MFGFKVSQISIKCTKAERSRNLDHSKKENLKGFSIDTNKLCNKLANRYFQIGLNSFIAFRICKCKVSLRWLHHYVMVRWKRWLSLRLKLSIFTPRKMRKMPDRVPYATLWFPAQLNNVKNWRLWCQIKDIFEKPLM